MAFVTRAVLAGHLPSGWADYLTVTSMVSDPVYLRAIYYTTEIFAREADGSM